MPVLIFIAAVWVLWSPVVALWFFGDRQFVSRYCRPIIAAYASLVLIVVLTLSGQFVSAVVMTVVALIAIPRALMRARNR